VSEVCADVILN